MTEYKKNWILYDGACPVCVRLKNRLSGLFERRGFTWERLQADWVVPTTGLSEAELMTEMKVLSAEGEIIGGVDAWIYLAGHVWWMYPFYLIGCVPWFRKVLDRGYRVVAANRYCVAGVCRLGGD